MVPRHIKDHIVTLLGSFSAVALLGPRQAGKMTLARTFSNQYFDLEIESKKIRLDLQWEAVMRSKDLVILDEAQNGPVSCGKYPSF